MKKIVTKPILIEAPNRLFIDIETSPALGWFWTSGKQYISADNILEEAKIICVSSMWEQSGKIVTEGWTKQQCDKRLLDRLGKRIDKADEVIAYNGRNFDIRWLNTRLADHSLAPYNITLVNDMIYEYKKTFKIPSYKLDYLLKRFKIKDEDTGEQATKADTGGIKLWIDTWYHNDRSALKTMMEYCAGDVKHLPALCKRLAPYVKQTLNLAVWYEDNRICPSCGGKLIINQHRKMISQKQIVTQYRCTSCGRCATNRINQVKKPGQYPV